MKIALAADHRGHAMKEKVAVLLGEQGYEVLDMGTNSSQSCDYPNLAYPAARLVAEACRTVLGRARLVADGTAPFAILVCGSGIGMSICANKVAGVRAALCHDELTAQMSRRHNNANVLCLASDVLGEELIRRIVSGWLTTEFEPGGRHERRVRKIALIEQGKDPSTYNGDNDLTGD